MDDQKEALIQREYIRKMQSVIRRKADALGHVPTYFIETLGCQMNAKDSEKFAGILTEIGYEKAPGEFDADLVLYNTCTVRENANTKIYGHLGQLGAVKKHRNPDMRIALCGCMMQEPDEVQTVREKYPFVDLVFGTHNVFKLAELLYRMETEEGQVIDVWEGTDMIVEDLPAIRKYRFKTGVNIMYGCNNFCSYCIVPYVRGRERSRTPESILEEIRCLASDGVREVMLLGQNVNSYGKTLDPKVTFSELLREVAKVDGIDRVRFMTSHPKDLSDELIATMASDPKICNHIHLPLQSGSDRILRAMNRHYDTERFLEIVEKLRKTVPEIQITTDLIVGFPGETEEDFQDTLDMVRKARFASAFTFLYSRRTGTPAAKMPDQVPDESANERFQRLLSVVQEVGREESGKLTGRTLPVLVDETNRQDKTLVTGRLADNTVVHFPGGAELVGEIVPVFLRESKGFYYMGERR